MSLPDQLFKPERYTHKDYLLWKGDWELINGYPFAMAPSPNRTHQWLTGKFIQILRNQLDEKKSGCNCQAYSELDWVVDNDTIVRPDCMIVCGEFTEDYLRFTPSLIIEISSHSTKLKDRNTKYTLYEIKQVKYYIIADAENKTAEIFELAGDKYKLKLDFHFTLSPECMITIKLDSLWESM